MLKFESHQFVVDDAGIDPTGEIEVFSANSIEQAVDSVIKSKEIDGYTVSQGNTGRTIKAGNFWYAIVPSKRV